jgi:general secretion pathway protein E/type IV pilus assembly protein PilB
MKKPALSPAFCAANGIIITGIAGQTIHFGMLSGDNPVLKTRIKRAYPACQCVFQTLDPDDFNLKLAQLYSDENPDEPAAGAPDSRESIIDRVACDAPAVNLLNSIFLEALSKRASDIHIESGGGGSVVRYRIDGLLHEVKSISPDRALAVSARLKILANLNVLENRRPQDGHLDVKTDSYSLDVRVSIVPTVSGESIVLRLLNRSDTPCTLDSLGFSAQYAAYLRDILTTVSGLILVTGPTGSGKTTTLAAILKELSIHRTKIISIEDPVEYRIEGVTQIPVREELGLTFDTLLRRVFRQDPDIIMIGEIRDIETADLAVRAALTGHLVFATLHTNNALEAVYRLQNMGIPAYLAAAVLKITIAQRLIRKICTACNAAGCPRCHHCGYQGRTVIAEFIPVTPELAGMIAAGTGIEKMRSYLQDRGHLTIFDDAHEKKERGITTDAEIRRELGGRP